jgi:hypothetical protein
MGQHFSLMDKLEQMKHFCITQSQLNFAMKFFLLYP